ncbi:MAG: hypothetical protein Q4E69_01005 [Bacilli bacterium]|nr:hypothetical protein [Bacilli bacterium]
MNIGFTIGKFAPLHLGHDELIRKGIKENDKFYILINDTDVIDIDLDRRAKWLNDLYPEAIIIKGYNPPKRYGMDKESIEIQINYLKEVFKDIPVTRFYSGEDYGYYVAMYMNVEFIKVNKNIPVSATNIRKDFDNNKQYISKEVLFDIENKKN